MKSILLTHHYLLFMIKNSHCTNNLHKQERIESCLPFERPGHTIKEDNKTEPNELKHLHKLGHQTLYPAIV